MGKKWIGMAAGITLALSAVAGDWPQFCGPTRDNISTEAELADAWPESGPKVLWEAAVFDGYSGAAVRDGMVYLIDRDGEESLLRCLDLSSGKEAWRCAFADPGSMSGKKFAGTRGTPTVTDEAAYLVTGYGMMVCIDLKTKSVRWSHSLLDRFGMSLNSFGMSQSPVVLGDLVLVAPTSDDVGVVAYNRMTGEQAWASEALGGFSFASPVVFNLCGEDMVVAIGSQKSARRGRRPDAEETEPPQDTNGRMAGISPKDGTLLWSYEGWQCRNAIPYPVLVPDNRLFITGGYDAGSAMIRIAKTDAGFTVEELFRTDVAGAQIHQPIPLDGHLLIGSNSNKRNDGLACLKLDGTLAWRTKDIDGAPNFERGSFILVDGKIVILDGKTGRLHLLKADVSGYHELASAPMVKENDMAWAPMALSDGKLLLRDWNTLKCVDLK